MSDRQTDRQEVVKSLSLTFKEALKVNNFSNQTNSHKTEGLVFISVTKVVYIKSNIVVYITKRSKPFFFFLVPLFGATFCWRPKDAVCVFWKALQKVVVSVLYY